MEVGYSQPEGSINGSNPEEKINISNARVNGIFMCRLLRVKSGSMESILFYFSMKK